jgi:hypothetical protein
VPTTGRSRVVAPQWSRCISGASAALLVVTGQPEGRARMRRTHLDCHVERIGIACTLAWRVAANPTVCDRADKARPERRARHVRALAATRQPPVEPAGWDGVGWDGMGWDGVRWDTPRCLRRWWWSHAPPTARPCRTCCGAQPNAGGSNCRSQPLTARAVDCGPAQPSHAVRGVHGCSMVLCMEYWWHFAALDDQARLDGATARGSLNRAIL